MKNPWPKRIAERAERAERCERLEAPKIPRTRACARVRMCEGA